MSTDPVTQLYGGTTTHEDSDGASTRDYLAAPAAEEPSSMAANPSVLSSEVLDFPGSNITVSQILGAYIRKAQAGPGDLVQVTTEEHGELNIFRAVVEFDIPGCLRLVRDETVTDDNFLAPLSSFEDEVAIAQLAGMHGADSTRRILYAAARGLGGLYLITGAVPDAGSERDLRMREIYAATAHLA